MVALSAVYFDESGTHPGSPVMTVAGYVFTREQARRFSRDWQKDLARIGLPCAHMTDCALGKGDYEHMSLEDRVESEKLLIEHIKRRSQLGLSIAIRPDEFDAVMGNHSKAISAYSLLLMVSIVQISDWARLKGFKGRFVYIFEAGHRHAPEANKFMEALMTLGPTVSNHHYYAGHAFLDKKQAVPLQAADMLAWLHRNNVMRRMRGQAGHRKDFAALIRPFDLGTHIQTSHLVELKQMIDQGEGIFANLPDRVLKIFPPPVPAKPSR